MRITLPQFLFAASLLLVRIATAASWGKDVLPSLAGTWTMNRLDIDQVCIGGATAVPTLPESPFAVTIRQWGPDCRFFQLDGGRSVYVASRLVRSSLGNDRWFSFVIEGQGLSMPTLEIRTRGQQGPSCGIAVNDYRLERVTEGGRCRRRPNRATACRRHCAPAIAQCRGKTKCRASLLRRCRTESPSVCNPVLPSLPPVEVPIIGGDWRSDGSDCVNRYTTPGGHQDRPCAEDDLGLTIQQGGLACTRILNRSVYRPYQGLVGSVTGSFVSWEVLYPTRLDSVSSGFAGRIVTPDLIEDGANFSSYSNHRDACCPDVTSFEERGTFRRVSPTQCVRTMFPLGPDLGP